MAYIVAGLIATGSNAFSTGGAQNNSAVTLPGPDAAFATTGDKTGNSLPMNLRILRDTYHSSES